MTALWVPKAVGVRDKTIVDIAQKRLEKAPELAANGVVVIVGMGVGARLKVPSGAR